MPESHTVTTIRAHIHTGDQRGLCDQLVTNGHFGRTVTVLVKSLTDRFSSCATGVTTLPNKISDATARRWNTLNIILYVRGNERDVNRSDCE